MAVSARCRVDVVVYQEHKKKKKKTYALIFEIPPEHVSLFAVCISTSPDTSSSIGPVLMYVLYVRMLVGTDAAAGTVCGGLKYRKNEKVNNRWCKQLVIGSIITHSNVLLGSLTRMVD